MGPLEKLIRMANGLFTRFTHRNIYIERVSVEVLIHCPVVNLPSTPLVLHPTPRLY
jgi:hypothetical protein